MKKIISLFVAILLVFNATFVSASQTLLSCDFENGDISDFSVAGGDWSVTDLSGNKVLSSKNPDVNAVIYIGKDSWTNYCVEVDVMAEDLSDETANKELGIIFNDSREGNYYKIYFTKGGFRFNNVIKEGESTVKWKMIEFAENKFHNIKVDATNGSAKIYLDGELLLEIDKLAYTSGRIGLFVKNTAVVSFDNVKVNGDLLAEKPNFTDINNHWAKTEIGFLTAMNVIKGIDSTHFAPDETITRAQFITLAERLISAKTPAYNNEFADVNADDWYAQSLAKAYQSGIIDENMIENGCIKPNAPITREEMTSVIVNTAKQRGNTFEKDDISKFTDADKISDWAKDYTAMALAGGIIQGVTETTFEPKSNATRAQSAVMIFRLLHQ